MQYVSKSLLDTFEIAKDISKCIHKGSIVLMNGDLGVGKTALTKCLCENWGVEDVVSSPSFTIIKQYKAKDFKIFHIDLYRLSSEEELIEIGFEEILNDQESIKIIEWPDCAKEYYKGLHIININIETDDDQSRIIEVL